MADESACTPGTVAPIVFLRLTWRFSCFTTVHYTPITYSGLPVKSLLSIRQNALRYGALLWNTEAQDACRVFEDDLVSGFVRTF